MEASSTIACGANVAALCLDDAAFTDCSLVVRAVAATADGDGDGGDCVDVVYPAHRVIVSRLSPVLAAALQPGFARATAAAAGPPHIVIECAPAVAPVFPVVRSFLYGAPIALSAATVVGVLALADALMVSSLQAQALTFLSVCVHRDLPSLALVCRAAHAADVPVAVDVCRAAARDRRSGFSYLLRASVATLRAHPLPAEAWVSLLRAEARDVDRLVALATAATAPGSGGSSGAQEPHGFLAAAAAAAVASSLSSSSLLGGSLRTIASSSAALASGGGVASRDAVGAADGGDGDDSSEGEGEGRRPLRGDADDTAARALRANVSSLLRTSAGRAGDRGGTNDGDEDAMWLATLEMRASRAIGRSRDGSARVRAGAGSYRGGGGRAGSGRGGSPGLPVVTPVDVAVARAQLSHLVVKAVWAAAGTSDGEHVGGMADAAREAAPVAPAPSRPHPDASAADFESVGAATAAVWGGPSLGSASSGDAGRSGASVAAAPAAQSVSRSPSQAVAALTQVQQLLYQLQDVVVPSLPASMGVAGVGSGGVSASLPALTGEAVTALATLALSLLVQGGLTAHAAEAVAVGQLIVPALAAAFPSASARKWLRRMLLLRPVSDEARSGGSRAVDDGIGDGDEGGDGMDVDVGAVPRGSHARAVKQMRAAVDSELGRLLAAASQVGPHGEALRGMVWGIAVAALSNDGLRVAHEDELMSFAMDIVCERWWGEAQGWTRAAEDRRLTRQLFSAVRWEYASDVAIAGAMAAVRVLAAGGTGGAARPAAADAAATPAAGSHRASTASSTAAPFATPLAGGSSVYLAGLLSPSGVVMPVEAASHGASRDGYGARAGGDSAGTGAAAAGASLGVTTADITAAWQRHQLAGMVSSSAAAVALGLAPPRLSYGARCRAMLMPPPQAAMAAAEDAAAAASASPAVSHVAGGLLTRVSGEEAHAQPRAAAAPPPSPLRALQLQGLQTHETSTALTVRGSAGAATATDLGAAVPAAGAAPAPDPTDVPTPRRNVVFGRHAVALLEWPYPPPLLLTDAPRGGGGGGGDVAAGGGSAGTATLLRLADADGDGGVAADAAAGGTGAAGGPAGEASVWAALAGGAVPMTPLLGGGGGGGGDVPSLELGSGGGSRR